MTIEVRCQNNFFGSNKAQIASPFSLKLKSIFFVLFAVIPAVYKSKHQNPLEPFKIRAYTIFIKNKAVDMRYCLECGHEAEYKVPEMDNMPRLVCPNCGYIHYENPKVICGTLVVHESKVLLCRRAIEPRYGYWTVPAGFMENGETIAEGAARESFEEAEASVLDPHLYCIYDIPDIGQIYILYLATLKDGAFGSGVESLECALFDEADVPWDDIAFEAVSRTLKRYFADRKAHNSHSDFPVHQDLISKDKSIKRY